jgi:adenylate cyclase
VAGAIEPKLRLAEIERARRKPTDTLDVYDLYLRGLAEFRKVTREGYEEAFRLAQQALAIDPSCGPAAALAASCRTLQASEGWIRNTPETAIETVALAKRALDIGKDDPEALWMAAHAIGQFAGDIPMGMGAIERALALNPNAAHAWNIKGWLNLYLDRADAAIEAFERAIRLSPLEPQAYLFTTGMARAHLTAGRYEEAMVWIDRAIAEQPRLITSLRIKVVLQQLMGRDDQAREWLARLREAAPEMTVESFRAYAARHYTPQLRALYVDALRKAGLPEE